MFSHNNGIPVNIHDFTVDAFVFVIYGYVVSDTYMWVHVEGSIDDTLGYGTTSSDKEIAHVVYVGTVSAQHTLDMLTLLVRPHAAAHNPSLHVIHHLRQAG